VKERIRKFLGSYWAILWIVLAWLLFAQPYILEGLVPFPSDYLVDSTSPWNNYFGLPVQNSAMPDVISQMYPWKQLVIDSWKSGQIPFWNPYQFAGNPHLANYQSSVFSIVNVLYLFIPFIHAWSIQILLQPLLAGLFMYLYLKKLDISKAGSLAGSLSFMFSGFITVWMEYGTLAYAILYLPLLLYGIESYYKRQNWKIATIILVSAPLSLFSGHFQTSLYMLMAGVLYVVYKAIITNSYKLSIHVLLFIAGGVVLSFPQLLPSIQFYQQAVRSGSYQSGGITTWGHLITILAPDFFGNPVTGNSWLGHYGEWATFSGVVPTMLAMLAVIYQKLRKTIFYISLIVLALLLSYSEFFIQFIVDLHIPVLSTSTSSRIIVLFSFSVAVLAGFGFDNLQTVWKEKTPKLRLAVYTIFWLLLVISVWAMLLNGYLPFLEKVGIDGLSIAKRNFILPSILMVFVVSMFFIQLLINKLPFRKNHRKAFIVVGILLILLAISFDMLRFSSKWIPFSKQEFMYPEISVLKFMSDNSNNSRVFGNFGNAAVAPMKIGGIEGYDPLYIQRYGEFIMSVSSGSVSKSPSLGVNLDKNGLYTKKVLDILGVKYIMHSVQDKQNVWAFPFWKYPESFAEPVWADDKYEVYENTEAFPRVFVVLDYVVANSDQEIVNYMTNDLIELREVVVLEQDPLLEISSELDCELSIAEIAEYTPNKVIINVETDCNGLLFLSDNYYPGWNVYLDGTKSNIYRANYTFRAVVVPEGDHRVIFKYENWYF